MIKLFESVYKTREIRTKTDFMIEIIESIVLISLGITLIMPIIVK